MGVVRGRGYDVRDGVEAAKPAGQFCEDVISLDPSGSHLAGQGYRFNPPRN
jgi:hypothetical protein